MHRIVDQTLQEFAADLASEKPSPGGGSAAAVSGILAASLVQMVARLTLGRKKYADTHAEMERVVGEAIELSGRLALLADSDARAYDSVMAAYKLPKGSEVEQSVRGEAIASALQCAAQVPLETARLSSRVLELVALVVEKGNLNAVTDAGVGALLAVTAFQAAAYNVRINISSVGHKPTWGLAMEKEVTELEARNVFLASQVNSRVLSEV